MGERGCSHVHPQTCKLGRQVPVDSVCPAPVVPPGLVAASGPWWFCLAGPQRDQHPSNQLPRWLQLTRSASLCLQLPWKPK